MGLYEKSAPTDISEYFFFRKGKIEQFLPTNPEKILTNFCWNWFFIELHEKLF